MPLILPGNVASATADAGYNVANSCRFNSGDSAYMHKTPGGAGNRRTFTISVWVKRTKLGANQFIISAGPDGNSQAMLKFRSDDTLFLGNQISGSMDESFITNRVFRDCSAWYHIVCSFDTTDGTEGDRTKIYINGVQETSFSTEDQPAQNYDWHFNLDQIHEIGKEVAGSNYFDGYMAEFVGIDGTAYAASDFGEFDEDSPTIWKPKDVSGLTFGTNGFYLDFEASDNLGNDANGGTDLTEVNLAATDQSIDVPTNNFPTMNILQVGTANWVFTEGNLHVAIPSSTNWKSIYSTFGAANGKWYYEVKVSGNFATGIGLMGGTLDNHASLNGSDSDGYNHADVWRYRRNGSSAYYSVGSTSTEIDTVPADDDIIGIAYNADAGLLYSSINGSWQNSATIAEIAAGTTTNALFDDITTGVTFAIFGSTENADNLQYNFGNPVHSISSANADGNGYGSFEYAVPGNFFALCTKNLAEYG